MGRYVGYRRDLDDVWAFGLIALVVTSVAAFIRHVWWIITICMTGSPVTGGQVVLAIFGIMFPPFGALHGIWLWLH